MKLLFCIKAMNNPGGGAERVLADVSNGLAERGHEVTVLTFESPGGTSFYPLDARVKRIEMGMGSTTAPATAMSTLRRIVALRRAVKAHAPDVAIAFMHSMFIPLGLALIGTSIPVIASEHIVPDHYRSRRPIEALLLSITPFLVERITCVSEQVRQSYPSYLRHKMIAVANPVSVKVNQLADAIAAQNSRKTVLSVGRLEPQKDLLTLIQAFSKIADELPMWDLRIVGDGSLREDLELAIADLNLTERVQLPGSTSNIATEYQAAQLFVIPSRYESFGLTTIEALAHGLAAVGFHDCLGINQIICPGLNGELVDGSINRVLSLAETLRKLMADDALRAKLSQPSHSIPEEHRLKNVLDCWEALFFETQKSAPKTSSARLISKA